MADKVSTPSKTKVVTGKVRLSYVHLLEPYSAGEDQKASYSCVLLIPKSDKATMRALKAAQQEALEAGKSKFGGKIPTTWVDTIHDGDEADLERNPEYENHWSISVRAQTRPGIIDGQKQPITSAEEVYSGCYARVSVNAFAFNTKGNKGVSFGLNNVQVVADGEFLGGRSKAEDDFDFVEADDVDPLS